MANLRPSEPPLRVEYDDARYAAPIRDFLARNRQESSRFVENAPERSRWLSDHVFRPSADLCVDGRVSDFALALGLPPGIAKLYRSAGARHNVFTSWHYSKRVLEWNRRIRQTDAGGMTKRMVELRFVTVHHSSSKPQDASCAAWEHRTDKAVEAMRRHAAELNRCFAGHLVALVAIVDTDLDALELLAPTGRVAVTECLESCDSPDLRTALRRQLEKIIPPTWEPLTRFDPGQRNGLYHELSELLASNAVFARRARNAARPIELLDHQERLIFVGRPLETTDHNAAFLIEDGEKEHIRYDFGIAIRYVAKSLLAEALAAEDRDWVIPLIISIPHDADDREMTVMYARGIRADLETELRRIKPALVEWCVERLTGSSSGCLPDWMFKALANLDKHVAWCTTTNDRRTRLFVPCD